LTEENRELLKSADEDIAWIGETQPPPLEEWTKESLIKEVLWLRKTVNEKQACIWRLRQALAKWEAWDEANIKPLMRGLARKLAVRSDLKWGHEED
jgi:hypothetical protein